MSIRAALAGPLGGFTAYKQFILYRLVPRAGGKADKLPCSITGEVVSAHNSAHWMSADQACSVAEMFGEGYGVGFVFTEQDPFWFLDIDGGLQGGQWSPLALSLFQALPGCAAEISGSLTGGHIFGVGTMPPHRSKNVPLGLELYHTGRFVALTGIGAVGNVLTDMSAVLPALVATYFPADVAATVEPGEGPCEGWNGPTDDEELIRRALLSKSTSSTFGGKAGFSDLWNANEEVLSRSYPDAGGRSYDASSADAALAQHLAFWTGNDTERMHRLMMRPDNKLARDKYEREDYLPRTIRGACSRQSDVLQDKPKPSPSLPVSMTVPSGAPSELGPEDFWAILPNHNYINRVTRQFLSVEAINGHLKRFTDTLGMKPAAYLDMVRACQQMSWHPGQPEVIEGMVSDKGELRADPKGRIYNLYRPTDAVGSEADATPWLNHLNYLYPDEAEHLIKWFAYRLQHPGEKLNHALLIGGDQGIGKDLLLTPIRYGVGTHNVAEVNPPDLFKDFTQWVECTLLVINEARNLGDESKYSFYESSKRFIAAPPNTLTCNKKHLAAYEVPNVMGVVITSNNKLNGLYIDADDRRHFVAWSKASKAPKEYFDALWSWLEEGGGKQAVVGYLMRYPLNGWNAKEPPPKTEAWHQIVTANSNPEDSTLTDVLDGIKIATVREIVAALQFGGHAEMAAQIQKAPRKVPIILERIGLEPLINPNGSNARWRLADGRKETLYVDKNLPQNEKLLLAQARVAKS